MMFRGVQQYTPPPAIMGMGMGMERAAINRPTVPYPTILL
ncbi:hypothetical protein Tco_1205604, partial [Tanacetum coccineum]